jgi:hypothetical protein
VTTYQDDGATATPALARTGAGMVQTAQGLVLKVQTMYGGTYGGWEDSAQASPVPKAFEVSI